MYKLILLDRHVLANNNGRSDGQNLVVDFWKAKIFVRKVDKLNRYEISWQIIEKFALTSTYINGFGWMTKLVAIVERNSDVNKMNNLLYEWI